MGILNANVTKKKKKKNPDIFICWKILDTPKDKKWTVKEKDLESGTTFFKLYRLSLEDTAK